MEAPGSSALLLGDGWEICALAPGAVAEPDSLPAFGQPPWLQAPRLATVAAILRDRGDWSLDAAPRRFDAEDWWYTRVIRLDAGAEGTCATLGLDGLATASEAWIDGVQVLASTSMHLAHRLALPLSAVARTLRLVIAFRALDTALSRRRPRPRWRVPMLEQQQLRWWRTTLIGRTPGWTPPVAPVGPWRPVWLEHPRAGATVDVRALQSGLRDTSGTLVLRAQLRGFSPVERFRLRLRSDDGGHEVVHAFDWHDAGDGRLDLALSIPEVLPWWPHSHGQAVLYRCALEHPGRDGVPGETFSLGDTGFRSAVLQREDQGFALRINGVRVFCRGVCWTPIDVVRLDQDPETLRAAVAQVRELGFNMLRLSGALVYESPAFFRACDESGILIWQDFMFANMDYPEGDPEFQALVALEAEQQLALWARHPCLAVICGNSEASQQAAMWGAARGLWESRLFTDTLAAHAAAGCPGVPYWPSSAFGGDFPHQVDQGTTSYYGVGAYLRPLADARLSGLRFATECLAFANVPDAQTIARMPGGQGLRVHHGAWKSRTCRDLNAGWDFEDVRDHYLKLLHGLDPMALRYADHERYLELSRVVSGQVMARCMSDWRRSGSPCAGALVWYLRDFWAGAGWGLLDDLGRPKACAWILRRALQPTCVSVSDEGNNGLYLQVVHDRGTRLAARLEARAFDADGSPRWTGATELVLEAHGSVAIPLMRLAEHFEDFSHAFRFGPRGFHALGVTLSAAGEVLSEHVWYPDHDPLSASAPEPRLAARALQRADGQWEIVIETSGLACHVNLVDINFEPSDQYFDLPPGGMRALGLMAPGLPAGEVPRGYVAASNLRRPVAITRPGPGG